MYSLQNVQRHMNVDMWVLRHMFAVTQLTFLLCDTAGVSAVRHSRHVNCVTQKTRLLCNIADMSAV